MQSWDIRPVTGYDAQRPGWALKVELVRRRVEKQKISQIVIIRQQRARYVSLLVISHKTRGTHESGAVLNPKIRRYPHIQ